MIQKFNILQVFIVICYTVFKPNCVTCVTLPKHNKNHKRYQNYQHPTQITDLTRIYRGCAYDVD